MKQVHRDVRCNHLDLWQTHLPQEVADSGGAEGVDTVIASSTDPDKTAIKTQELTFNHYRSQPFVPWTYLAFKTSQRKQNLNFPSKEIENCNV